TPRGSLDREFGRGGIAELPHRGGFALPAAVGVQRDGRVVLAGDESFSLSTPPAPCGYCLFLTAGRLTAAGTPDRSFGQEGVVHTKLELSPSTGLGIALQRDGRIVLAGGIQDGGSSSFLVARLLRSGAF